MAALRWLRSWLYSLARSVGRWLGRMAKTVLVNDPDATPVQSYAPIEVLTGAQTDSRTIYVGDEDPAIDHLADLIEGDVWVDTTFGPSPSVKSRNVNNDGWFVGSLILYDALGVALGEVRVDAVSAFVGVDGASVAVANADGGGPKVTISGPNGTNLQIDSSGNIIADASGYIAEITASHVALFTPSGPYLELAGTNILMGALPTADPTTAGALWNDTGTVKVSAG